MGLELTNEKDPLSEGQHIIPLDETAMFGVPFHPDKVLTVSRHLAEGLTCGGVTIGQRKGDREEAGDLVVFLQLHCRDAQCEDCQHYHKGW